MTENIIQMQVYYEIAMSIGNSLNLKKMTRESLSAYLRKLNCSAGFILSRNPLPNGNYALDPIYTVPRNIEKNKIFRAALAMIPPLNYDKSPEFMDRLPLRGNTGNNRYFTIMDLPGFGLLILVKSGMDLDPPIIQSLRPLNEKLAKALIACIQNERIETYNQDLRSEIAIRESTEEALRESEERYRILVENAPLGIISVDRDGRIVNINQTLLNILGSPSREETVSINILEFPLLIEAGISGNFRRCLMYEESGVFETEYVSSWERKSYMRYHLNPIRNNEGMLMGAQAIVEDISTTKQLESQLQHAQKMEAVGTLAGGIAHDFNNLLMAIQGNVSLMLYGMDPGHPNHDRLRNIETQIKSGAKLTGQLLGYARKGQYDISSIDLNELIQETSEAFGRAKKEISIERDLEAGLNAIDADRNQIEQIMYNLFVNASDAMPNGGSLLLRTRNITHEDIGKKPFKVKQGEFVVFQVLDEGEGIDKKTMDRIFEPFFTTKEMGRGTGLGLASVYGIVKAHGGYIDVESERKKGTTFNLYFPASRKVIRKQAKTMDGINAGSETIMFVDDETMVLDVGADILRRLGYSVLETSSGKDAIGLYKKYYSGIDLIILDMIMPGMKGGQVYDTMKTINPDAKVLLSSGYNIDGEASEIIDRGCNGFIQKPFVLEELSRKVREILDE